MSRIRTPNQTRRRGNRVNALHRLAAGMILALAGHVLAQSSLGATGSAPADSNPAKRGLSVVSKERTGDFDTLLAKRIVRVDVPYSRSLYFNDKGRERGLAAELVRDFERWLNQKYAKQLGKRPLTVYLIPATRDKLLPDVAGGLADIAVGNLTVTDERLRIVDFVTPAAIRPVDEVVVTGPASPQLATLDDLAGKTVHVRRASSYFESLTVLNARFKAAGKPEIVLVVVPDALEDEDMLEMLNTGLLQVLVVDDWKARMWAQALPKLAVRTDLVLRDDGRVGWAIRKGSPKLAAEIEDFHRNWAAKQGVIEYRLAQSMKRVKELKDPTASGEWKRFKDTLALFEKYGNKYDFDPLMLAAQGYQESTLDQNAKSHVGAIGVMQIMPATGAQLGVGDIREIEANIHGGAKYMNQLMAKYFPDAKFSEGNRPLFAFASYNCGPGNVARMRREAAKRGLDPDKWFNNVEIVTAEKIGIETTTYVRNIYKYYVAYKLLLEAHAVAEQARRQVAEPVAVPVAR
jgi:membrane-bound lytic murein transglycosylase MltF